MGGLGVSIAFWLFALYLIYNATLVGVSFLLLFFWFDLQLQVFETYNPSLTHIHVDDYLVVWLVENLHSLKF